MRRLPGVSASPKLLATCFRTVRQIHHSKRQRRKIAPSSCAILVEVRWATPNRILRTIIWGANAMALSASHKVGNSTKGRFPMILG